MPILVREIFLGNMTTTCTEKDLWNNLGIYGEIENIDLF
jgi:RNA recognition motif-containing protein